MIVNMNGTALQDVLCQCLSVADFAEHCIRLDVASDLDSSCDDFLYREERDMKHFKKHSHAISQCSLAHTIPQKWSIATIPSKHDSLFITWDRESSLWSKGVVRDSIAARLVTIEFFPLFPHNGKPLAVKKWRHEFATAQ
jgi:hypothetical protein